jgi:hypothetical protein
VGIDFVPAPCYTEFTTKQQLTKQQQPMKQLHSVKITYNVLVMADDDDDAYFVASDNIGAIVKDIKDPNIEVQDCIESEDDLDEDWDNAFPYGVNPQRLTCLEIVKQNNEIKVDDLSEEEKGLILSRLTTEQIRELLDL